MIQLPILTSETKDMILNEYNLTTQCFSLNYIFSFFLSCEVLRFNYMTFFFFFMRKNRERYSLKKKKPVIRCMIQVIDLIYYICITVINKCSWEKKS